MSFLQLKTCPKAVVARLDAAAKLLGIKKEELAEELLEDAMEDVEELENKLRDARKRRLAKRRQQPESPS